MAKLSDLTKEQLLEIYIEKKFKKILKEELDLSKYKTKDVDISSIKPGDTILHNDGKVRTVSANNIKKSQDMGITLFGDSYKLGHQKVKKVLIGKEALDEISLTGLGNIGSKIIGKTDAFADKLAGGIESGANAVKDKAVGLGKAVANKAVNATNAVTNKASEIGKGISREYDKGVMTDLDARIMMQLGKIKEAVNKYNELAVKNGQPKINARKYMSFLNTIK